MRLRLGVAVGDGDDDDDVGENTVGDEHLKFESGMLP